MDKSEGAVATPPGRKRGTFIVWTLAFALGAVALASACIGWWENDGRPPPPTNVQGVLDWLDLPIRSVQVLLLSDTAYGEDVAPRARLWLQVARVSGALFYLLIAARILLLNWGDSLGKFMLQSRRGHLVLVGGGPATGEFALENHLGKVTQIAPDMEFRPGRFAHLPAEGTIGDIAAHAAAGRARGVLVNEATDEKTWQSAVSLSRHLPEQEVVAILGALEHDLSDVRLRSISYADGVARKVMFAHPPYLLASAMAQPVQHILILGFGAVGQALLREFAVTCPVLDPFRMIVTVVATDATERAKSFHASHPGLAAALEVSFVDGALEAGDDKLNDWIRERQQVGAFCAVYLAPDDATFLAGRAEGLRNLAIKNDLFRAPICWFSEGGAALANVRHGSGLLGPPLKSDEERAKTMARATIENRICELSLVPFGSWRDALDGAGLFAPELDLEARKIHQTYLAAMGGGAGAAGGEVSPAARPWETLGGEYRVSNRRAAAHVRAKVYAAGFDLNGWLDMQLQGRMTHELPPAASAFDAQDDEFLERMTRLEHRRWMLERLLSGWVGGESRNNFRKVHNMIRPYEELADEERRKDAAVVNLTRDLLGG